MELDALYAMTQHWRRYPPTHIALRRLERTLLAVNGVDPSTIDGEEKPARSCLMSESDMQALLASQAG